MTRVACLGECMVELAEQPDGLLRRSFGGDTLNTAIYLARCGVTVDYVTALGDDPFSDDMMAAWRNEGVGTRLVLRVRGALPGLYLIQTDKRGERRFSYWRDSAPVRRLFSLAEMAGVEASLADHDLLYLSGITLSLFDPPSRARLFRLLDAHRARGGRVAFDTNFRPRAWPDPDIARACFADMLTRTDLLLVGLEDWTLLHGTADERDVLSALRTLAAAEIVLKRSEHGCILLDQERHETVVPAHSVTAIIDTTAAGDSFAAAYIAARAAGCDPVEAARRGHHLAATVIMHRGALIPRSAMPLVIPNPIDQNRWAQSRRPIDMMRHG